MTSILITMFGYSILIPPLVEELSKLIAIIYNFNFAISFTLVFSIIEFFHYVNEIINNTGSFTTEYFLIRIFCIVLHFIFLGIQITGFKLFQKTKQKMYMIISFIGAYTLHVSWNIFLGHLTLSLIKQLL